MRDGVNRAGIIRRRTYPLKQQRAIEFRQSPTPAEACLWERLRGNRLDHLHFRRQHILDGFIVDFYCYKMGLVVEVVEVDGPIHQSQREQDEARDEYLATRGLRTLRVKNEDVLNHIDKVCTRIAEACKRPYEQ